MKNEGGYELKLLRNCPELAGRAADWFSSKWGIPAETYFESIRACVAKKTGVPQWYVALNARREIVAGAGVIENDFHQRKDLAPNLCALYVEQSCRGQGIARGILHFVRKDLRAFGFPELYLITDHTDFYERCGWKFFGIVPEDDNTPVRMYFAETIE